MTKLASDKQLSFLQTLMAERVHSITLDGEVTSVTASNLISYLLGSPRIPVEGAVTVTAGFYLLDGAVYRVVPSKSTGNLYAKRMTVAGTRGTWEYAPGAMRALVAAEALTVEDAARLGHHYGVCMLCGRTLTDPESVDAGIGPICAGKL